MELNESNTDSCYENTLSQLSDIKEDEDDNDFDDKKKHMIPFIYKCGDCSKSYKTSGYLFKHTNEQHGGKKCPDCDERFTSSSRYRFHINKHTGLRYSCIKCGKEFYYKANLTTHTNIHLGIKPHQCSTCKKTFSDRSACMRHEKLHSRVGKFETFCSVCGKSLVMAGRLEEYMKIHGGRKFSQEEKV